jgi:hypothetical protein
MVAVSYRAPHSLVLDLCAYVHLTYAQVGCDVLHQVDLCGYLHQRADWLGADLYSTRQ